MGEMVERAARAIYDLDKIGVREWSDAPASTREDCLACARAAIAAMREPTAAMINAGYTKLSGETFQRPREPMNAWPAMIDEALREDDTTKAVA